MEEHHKPVLLNEVLRVLDPKKGESYLDLTAGYAGHASAILDVTRNYKNSCLVDRDDYAVKVLKSKYESEGLKILHMDFYSAALQCLQCGNTFDLVLADLGVSSPQLDNGNRGFSFSKSGALDMRMDRRQELSAAEIVNKWSERELIDIFEKYGEMSPGFSRKVARVIRENRPFYDTKVLADAISGNARHTRVHPATKAFQAIRIVVNDELSQIEKTMPILPKLLNPGGRVAIITFHSLEDRIVKDYFKNASSMGEESELILINKSPIIAEKVELVNNPRARSAKLRAAIRSSNSS
ncbi:16S rRNA (cytosine(1402)-N(4))-methyltransferase RsmH [Candidatus Saccharibacteria bacterium]|nr:16S rRNA (cytosine(1402)-N(4))-methyltransferase RsmH [Candidatus Saccharibacteria bacterium]